MQKIWCSHKKANIEKFVPAIHFVLTFFFEKINFVYAGNLDIFLSIAREEGNAVNDFTEIIIVYCLSKIWALLIIWLLWELIFGILNRRIPREAVKLFLGFYIIGILICIFDYPDFGGYVDGYNMDNYFNFAYAIRFLPTYWHSIYTGAFYAGCMMVLPHPFAIFLFRWLAFVTVLGYIYCLVNKVWHNSNVRFFVLLFFIFPETFNILTCPYRNFDYTILCLFYFTYILFATKKDDNIGLEKLLKIAFLSAFMMVWRSEGILIGMGGFCLILIFSYRLGMKRIVATFLIFIFAFISLFKIQGIGAEKYYGKDYMIINTLNPLCSILNNPDASLSYIGAENDLEALECVLPVEIIRQSAIRGFRNYNYAQGRIDHNQTLVDDEIAKSYMRAYYRIIFHNMTDYLNVQINFFCSSLGIQAQLPVYSYSGDKIVWPTSTVREPMLVSLTGKADLEGTYLTYSWENSSIRKFLNTISETLIRIWRKIWTATGLNTFLHSGIIISNIVLMCREFVLVCLEKNKYHIRWFILWATNFGTMCIVGLFMPEGRPEYTYPVLYIGYLLLYLYLTEKTYGNSSDFINIGQGIYPRKDGTPELGKQNAIGSVRRLVNDKNEEII